MSLKTWMQEFYPVPAKGVTKKDALAHSLQKWKGLRKAGRAKHECNMAVYKLFNKTACALCLLYECSRCPVDRDCGAGCSALDHGDPEPMIAALEKALRKERAKKRRAAKRKGRK